MKKIKRDLNIFKLDHRYNYVSPEVYVATHFSEEMILALVSYAEDLCVEEGLLSYEDPDYYDEEAISNFLVFFFKAQRFLIAPKKYEILDLFLEETICSDSDKKIALNILNKYRITNDQIVCFLKNELEKNKNNYHLSMLKMNQDN